jgi:hypothetical protein
MQTEEQMLWEKEVLRMTAQQEPELLDRPFFCDGDCLSCDGDTYIRCDIRLHPERYKEIPNVR